MMTTGEMLEAARKAGQAGDERDPGSAAIVVTMWTVGSQIAERLDRLIKATDYVSACVEKLEYERDYNIDYNIIARLTEKGESNDH